MTFMGAFFYFMRMQLKLRPLKLVVYPQLCTLGVRLVSAKYVCSRET